MSLETWEQLVPKADLLATLDVEMKRRGAGSVAEGKPGCVDGSLGNAWSAEQYTSHDYPGAVEGFVFACYALRSLALNHCLVDGNKRLAWITFATVLATLDFTVDVSEEDAAAFVERIILDHLDGPQVVAWAADKLAVLPPPAK